jgi:hypothetical protein
MTEDHLLDRIAELERRIAALEAATQTQFPDTRKAGSIAPHKYDGWKIT